MTDNSRLRITCDCGKTIQKRNFEQHCSSKYHIAFITKQQLDQTNQSSSTNLIINLTLYLRELDLRSNSSRIQKIIERYENIDPYTKAKLEIENNENIPTNFHVDHIIEAQILACAIKHTPELMYQNGNILVLHPLRRVLNDISNLAITEARVNLSKGQAIKYFLGQYETNTDISLLAAFIQTASGKERSIAHFSLNIVDLIKETSPGMSESIREIRMDNGHITGAYRYEIVAEQFDTIIDRMKLDWNEGIKLRNGKIYQAYK
jgi:hypothetical protein